MSSFYRRLAPRSAKAGWFFGTILTLVGSGVAYGVGGPLAALGLVGGVAGSVLNLLGWTWLIRLGGMMMQDQPQPKRVTFLIILFFFVKLPLFVAMGVAAGQAGGPTLPSFLLGVGLVYSALAGTVLVKSQDL